MRGAIVVRGVWEAWVGGVCVVIDWFVVCCGFQALGLSNCV